MPESEPEMDKRDWSEVAKALIKAELKGRNMNYSHLVEALAAVGVRETEANLRNKISRGNFSAAFFLQALDAIGCTLVPAVPAGMTVLRGRARTGVSSLHRQRVEEFKAGQQETPEDTD
nr:DUF6471 domain-containing protein [uncultured Brevundimonas sp.]